MYIAPNEWGVGLYTDSGELIASAHENKAEGLATLAADLAYDFWGGKIVSLTVGPAETYVEEVREYGGNYYRTVSVDSNLGRSWRTTDIKREDALRSFVSLAKVDIRHHTYKEETTA